MELAQALGERVLVVRDDGAAGHEGEPRALDRDEPPAGAAQAGVDAEDAGRRRDDSPRWSSPGCRQARSSASAFRAGMAGSAGHHDVGDGHAPIFAIAASETSKFTKTFWTSSWSSSDSTRRMSFSAASSSTSTVFCGAPDERRFPRLAEARLERLRDLAERALVAVDLVAVRARDDVVGAGLDRGLEHRRRHRRPWRRRRRRRRGRT